VRLIVASLAVIEFTPAGARGRGFSRGSVGPPASEDAENFHAARFPRARTCAWDAIDHRTANNISTRARARARLSVASIKDTNIERY